jgi:hypothetical protein
MRLCSWAHTGPFGATRSRPDEVNKAKRAFAPFEGHQIPTMVGICRPPGGRFYELTKLSRRNVGDTAFP